MINLKYNMKTYKHCSSTSPKSVFLTLRLMNGIHNKPTSLVVKSLQHAQDSAPFSWGKKGHKPGIYGCTVARLQRMLRTPQTKFGYLLCQLLCMVSLLSWIYGNGALTDLLLLDGWKYHIVLRTSTREGTPVMQWVVRWLCWEAIQQAYVWIPKLLAIRVSWRFLIWARRVWD